MKNVRKNFLQEMSFLCTLPAITWQLFFMVAPVLIILFFSFVSPGLTLTLDYYRALWQSNYFYIILRSLVLAFTTGIATLFLGYPLAYFIGIRARKYKNILLFFLTLPFWVNFLVQVYAWYYLLEYHGLINRFLMYIGIISEPLMLSNSLFAVGLVMIYCYLPFMVMPLYTTLEKIDSRLLEASSDLGATPWQTFRHVTLPLSLAGIKTGLLLVLIPAFGEFVIPSLLGGGKNMLVGTLISYFFLVSRNNAYGAAFTCLSALALIASLVFFFLLSRIWIISRTVRSR